jgi:hypothetical protein
MLDYTVVISRLELRYSVIFQRVSHSFQNNNLLGSWLYKKSTICREVMGNALLLGNQSAKSRFYKIVQKPLQAPAERTMILFPIQEEGIAIAMLEFYTLARSNAQRNKPSRG